MCSCACSIPMLNVVCVFQGPTPPISSLLTASLYTSLSISPIQQYQVYYILQHYQRHQYYTNYIQHLYLLHLAIHHYHMQISNYFTHHMYVCTTTSKALVILSLGFFSIAVSCVFYSRACGYGWSCYT